MIPKLGKGRGCGSGGLGGPSGHGGLGGFGGDGMNGHKALNLMGIIMLDKNGGSWHYDDYGDPHRQLRRI